MTEKTNFEGLHPQPLFEGENHLNRTKPLHLGKNRLFADVGLWDLTRNWKAGIQTQLNFAELRKGDMRMFRDVTLCWTLGYGRDAPWPPENPAWSLNDFAKRMRASTRELLESSRTLRAMVTSHERLIQKRIMDVSNGKIQDVDLETVLNNLWKQTASTYNNLVNIEYVDKILDTPIFMRMSVSDDTDMAAFHSSDLDAFSLDFLDNVKDPHQKYCVTYRNGANYCDHKLNMSTMKRHADSGEELPGKAWPLIGFPPPCDNARGVFYNRDVEKHYQRVRANYLVPLLNLEDLKNPANLLSFIHNRGRTRLEDFARMDSDLMYLGRSSKMLAGAFSAMHVVAFGKQHSATEMELNFLRAHGKDLFHMETGGIAALSVLDEDRPRYKALHVAGHTLGSMEAWLVIRSQRLTYIFLDLLCAWALRGTEGEKDGVTGYPKILTTEDEINREYRDAVAALKEICPERPSWRDLPSVRQYGPVVTTVNGPRYLPALQSKKELAEEHLTKLFDEPDYFTKLVLEQKEHHWQNLTQNYKPEKGDCIQRYEELGPRHSLYYDCLRSVLRRAVFGFFIWPLVEKHLTAFCDEFERFKNDERNGHDQNLPLSVAPQLEKNETLYKRYHDLVYVVRYCAVLFLKEFASKAIHAASEPMRDSFSWVDQTEPWEKVKSKCPFPKGLYKDRMYTVKSTKCTLKAEDDTKLSRVAGMINNFLATRPTYMYAGVRKVTAQLQRWVDDYDDEEMRSAFTQLVADTIDGLDVLAEIAQHLDDFSCTARFIQETPEQEFLRGFSSACVDNSIDFFEFDDFPFEANGVPDKRIGRICKFLDESQGFKNKRTVTYGQARGDLKRLGASLLKNMIVPMNDKATYKASPEALERLEDTMRVRRDQYIYFRKELPLDLDTKDKIPVRWPTDRWLEEFKRIQKENRKTGKKKDSPKGASSEGFTEQIMVDDARQKMQAQRQAQELQRWRRVAQRRRKERWNRRTGGAARPDSKAPEDVEMGDEDEDEDSPMEDEPQPVPEPDVLPAPPAAQLPLPPAPQLREISLAPLSMGPVLASDGRPKTPLNKRVWETLLSLYGRTDSPVTYGELARALNYMGYQDEGRGGSHGVFTWTPTCRWPREALPKGRNIQIAKNHEGERKAVARGKAKDWGFRLQERGMTWEFVKKWYQKKT
ncbi:hypothetical protein AK830_g9219 [Neonectria ditissima]|uniref:Uncharacterized protein n=1 Tax=Neonectria ditissima TaxID=78410 RepID=A0A0P7B648_9HYPO|nr:hypothetical protein AK830_g9219 [Neonectria ditissima]